MDWSFAKRIAVVVSFIALLVGLSTSCEWTGGGGVDQFNSNVSNIDISVAGVYRNPDGGVIVSSFNSKQAVAATVGSTSSVNRTGESIAVGDGLHTAFSGNLNHAPVVVGSVTISAPPAFTLTDPDGDGTLTGTGGSSGTINYNTGAFSVDFGGTALDVGAIVTASYTSLEITEGTEGSNAETSPASNRTKIFSFNVEQAGNSIKITDNNGDTYNGTVGTAQVQNNRIISDTQTALSEVYQFSAEGHSGGVKVQLVGSFSAAVTVFFSDTTQINVTTTTGQLTEGQTELFRTVSLSVDGTWIEQDTGVTGNLHAVGPQNEHVETL